MDVLRFLFDAPIMDWIGFGIFFVGILLFIGMAEKLRTRMGWSAEVNRKLVHILTGILVFFTPFFFHSDSPLIWMAIIFIIVNYIGVRSGKLKGMHGTDRLSYGTVFYPLTFLFLVITSWQNDKVILMLSMLILALSDAGAAIMGENLKRPHEYRLGRDKKSLEGSSVMFLSSFLLIFLLLPLIDHIDGYDISFSTAAWVGLIVAVIATVMEALSSSGSDNLSAPLGSAFILNFMLKHSTQENVQFTIGLCLAFLVAVISYRARFLTASGSVGTFLLATLIFGIGGWVWATPILTFFVFSSLLSKIGKAHKTQFGLVFEKSSRRDIGQVLANGGVAGAALLLHHFYPNPIWYIVYLGALAAVNSDTWATEIGIFSRTPPRSIKNFRVVPVGSSGGITLLGLVSALLGSFVIALSGWLVAPENFQFSIHRLSFWLVVIVGFAAHLVDSLLGATVQAQYRCHVCQKITEKKSHCDGKETHLMSGHSWLNNDWVNAFCALSGGVFVWIGMRSVVQ
jgi:uncharacterized protein (TIGR00297 family)